MNAYSLIIGLLTVLGSLGIFLYGMKLMSEGLQKIAGNRMRTILAKMTSRPLSGVLTGTLVTSVIQSSSATTVMTVRFAKREKMNSIGDFIMGFALLFMGMEMLKNSIPDISTYPQVLEFIARFSDYGYASILLFVLIGTAFTMILQSSSAMMAITLVMCVQGWIGYEVAAAMVLGENIGTTIAANIAAAVANTNAKRVARSHFVFNVMGVIWMLIVFYPFLKLIAFITIHTDGANPFVSAAAIPIALSLFHSLFNIINTSVLIWFIPQIERIVSWMVKGDPEESSFRLKFITGGYLKTPELNLQAAQHEIEEFSKRVLRMYNFLPELRTAKNEEAFDKTFERIAKYEALTDRMEIEIASFLTDVGKEDLSQEASLQVSSMLRIVDNLESIGDAVFQLANLRKSKREESVHFSEELNANLAHMTDLVQNALTIMDANLNKKFTEVDLESAAQAEEAINQYRDQLRIQHLEALRRGTYNYAVGTAYSGLYALYEKLADYVINISEAITGKKIVE